MNSRDFGECGEQFHVFVGNEGERFKLILGRFWLSYLELCELLLSLIYTSRSGSWELYLSCIEEVLPWALACDCQNYALHLILFMNDMLSSVCRNAGNVRSLQQSPVFLSNGGCNLFECNEADKTIENTINHECKTGRGNIGFSASFAAIQRWVLSDARRGVDRKRLLQHALEKTSKS